MTGMPITVRVNEVTYRVAVDPRTAAIGKAVYHATGRRVRDLPITPAKLLA